MTLKLPDGMQLEDIPKPAIIKYDEGNMLFKHLVSYDSSTHMVTVNANFSNAKTNFDVKEYNTIRDFFEKMFEEESAVLVLKNTKKR